MPFFINLTPPWFDGVRKTVTPGALAIGESYLNSLQGNNGKGGYLRKEAVAAYVHCVGSNPTVSNRQC